MLNRIRIHSLWPVAVLSSSFLFAACGQGTGDTDPEGDSISVEEARRLGAEAYAPVFEAYCEWKTGCCTDAELEVERIGHDVEDCRARLLSPERAGDIHAPIEWVGRRLHEGAVAPDASAFDACIDVMQAASCASATSQCQPVGSVVGTICRPEALFVGKRGEEEACRLESAGLHDCAPGLRCADSRSDREAWCTKASAEGEGCDPRVADPCAPGLRCHPARGVCVATAAEGERCAYADPERPVPGTEALPCAPGLSCDPIDERCVFGACRMGAICYGPEHCPEGAVCRRDAHTREGICMPPLPDGQPCDAGVECESGRCVDYWGAFYCGGVLGALEPCIDSVQCEGDLACLPDQSFDWVCQAAVAEGATCVVEDACEAGLRCLQGKCVSPSEDGVACTQDSACASAWCRNGECVSPSSEGDACNLQEGDRCAEGLYCDADVIAGTCRSLKEGGAPCQHDRECWHRCAPWAGEYRCDGTAPGSTTCDGR